MAASDDASSFASQLYEYLLGLIVSGQATPVEAVFVFLAERGANTLDDQKIVLDLADDHASQRVEETEMTDEQVFEVYRLLFRARMELRHQVERKDFANKYSGHSHQEALNLDLAERTADWREALQEEQRLLDLSLAELQEHFKYVGDGLGLGIDDGIMDTVIALTANGVPTVASCEGHADRGLPFPWVDISHRHPHFGLTGESDPLKDELKTLNKPVYAQLEALLSEFYSRHDSSIRLGLDSSRLMPVAPDPYEHKENLEPTRTEMRAFTAFLLRRVERAQ